MNNDLAIDIHDVAKNYRSGLFSKGVFALRGVSLQVGRGEVFGLLGPNGAGKSTLVKIIMTVIRPSAARGTVLGKPVGSKSALNKVGYLPEHHRFPRYLTGGQVLDLFGGLAGVDKPTRKKRTPELLELVGMKDWANKPVSTYSKGMMQRVGIAQALIGEPDLLLLDEPTDGVDPVGRREIRDIVLHLKSQGKTVFLNSHLLSELELVCDRAAIMVGGVVARQGTLEQMALGRGHYEIQVSPEHAAQARSLLNLEQSNSPDSLIIPTLEAEQVQPMIDQLRTAQITIRKVQLVRPTLEDLFHEAVQEQYGQTGRAVGAKN